MGGGCECMTPGKEAHHGPIPAWTPEPVKSRGRLGDRGVAPSSHGLNRPRRHCPAWSPGPLAGPSPAGVLLERIGLRTWSLPLGRRRQEGGSQDQDLGDWDPDTGCAGPMGPVWWQFHEGCAPYDMSHSGRGQNPLNPAGPAGCLGGVGAQSELPRRGAGRWGLPFPGPSTTPSTRHLSRCSHGRDVVLEFWTNPLRAPSPSQLSRSPPPPPGLGTVLHPSERRVPQWTHWDERTSLLGAVERTQGKAGEAGSRLRAEPGPRGGGSPGGPGLDLRPGSRRGRLLEKHRREKAPAPGREQAPSAP